LGAIFASRIVPQSSLLETPQNEVLFCKQVIHMFTLQLLEHGGEVNIGSKGGQFKKDLKWRAQD